MEEEVYQVRNRSSQDPLNYPIRLNNKIAALMGVIESADHRPTDQTYEVFKELSAELEKQLQQMSATIKTELPRLNAALKREKVDAVDPDAKPAAVPPDDEEAAAVTSTARHQAEYARCADSCDVVALSVSIFSARSVREDDDEHADARAASCSASDARSRRNSTPRPRKTAAGEQRRPVQIARALVDVARVGAAPRGVDDRVGDVAIALAIRARSSGRRRPSRSRDSDARSSDEDTAAASGRGSAPE